MGGSAFDSYRICERMARVDIGLGTSVFATFLGSDPILMGGTEEQRKEWLGRIAEQGVICAYGATEPDAGSDLATMSTVAVPLERIEATGGPGYRITGRKQWISNGSIADVYTVLALAPGGPSWFVVERGTPGLSSAPKEDKHGIRLSDTAALFLDDVVVPADRLVGGVEGRGLVQAQQVFGYTRLMVAAFGLGGGWEAMDRAIRYSTERVQGGAPLSREAGLHPQADRPARRPAGGGPRRGRGDRDPDRRRRGCGRRPQHRGGHREVPRHRSGRGGRGRRDPGARGLRLHPPVPGGEDPPRRQDHHDLRGHLRDPRDDDRPGPLAGSTSRPAESTTRRSPATCTPCTAPTPGSAPTRRRWPWSAWGPSSRPAVSAG